MISSQVTYFKEKDIRIFFYLKSVELFNLASFKNAPLFKEQNHENRYFKTKQR